MAAHAGPLPWSKQYATDKLEGRGSKSAAKAAYKSSGRKWNPGSFHMEGETKVWDEDPHWMHNVTKGKGKRATWDSYVVNGRVEAGDLTDEYKKSKTLSHTSSAADYVDYSFEVDKDNVSSYEGCGHIAQFDYNSATLTLKVTFTTNGNVVAYFGVPSTVVGELIYAAKTKQTQYSMSTGLEVHTLGVRFWDLIRIRGNVHGSRYEFAYVTDNGTDGEFAGGWGHESRPVRDSSKKYDETEYLTEDTFEDLFREGEYRDNKGALAPIMVARANGTTRPVRGGSILDAKALIDPDTGKPLFLTQEQRNAIGQEYDKGASVPQLNNMIKAFVQYNKDNK